MTHNSFKKGPGYVLTLLKYNISSKKDQAKGCVTQKRAKPQYTIVSKKDQAQHTTHSKKDQAMY